MTDRILAWLGAGLLAAGVSATTIAGAAMAAAEDDAGARATTSQSPESTDKAASDASEPEVSSDSGEAGTDETAAEGSDDARHEEPLDAIDDAAVEADVDVADAGVDVDVDGAEDMETDADESSSGSKHAYGVSAEEPEATADGSDSPDAAGAGTATAIADEDEATEDEPSLALDTATDGVSEPEATPADAVVFDAQPSTTAVRFAMTAAVHEEPAAVPSLINVVGSFFWGLFDLVSKLVDLPPVVPPGSTVTAGRSTLEIDCGDGYTADADWYFPTEGEPDKLIYFQHGFPGRAGFYNLTLAELAERNNAIVFAPSITADLFACDGCRLMGDPMHAAVAGLFEGDRGKLLASARAAGYEGVLPEDFVISGQSAGGIAAAGAARYFEELAPAREKDNLVGVLLFDTADGGVLGRSLDKIPRSVPVLHIAGEPAPINIYGEANQVLEEKRHGQFNGVQLVGGKHGDAFQSSALFGIPQLAVSVALGFPKPENVEAAQVLSEGWLTDMYARRVYDPNARTGIYGDPGDPGEVLVDIPTDAGVAHGYVLPGPTPQLTLIDLLIRTVINAPTFIGPMLSTCAVDPSATASAQSVTTCSG